MTTQTVIARGSFVELLAAAQDYLKGYLDGHLLSQSATPAGSHSYVEEKTTYILALKQASTVLCELFDTGMAAGLTEREIMIALLRPLTGHLRPTAARAGCGCPRCSH